ncbi:hypothetical protein EGW08_000464 [Elysia chlorotica]|uniref:G-protein coupled receptors family 1 profile domain-containing protein n=1 Tax=Elysia chlorotica TaxID=188477 RepID=A0A433UD67_ELYCH|nr:hypothetical protein EGW08_000464 [Elysia chlorotica]
MLSIMSEEPDFDSDAGEIYVPDSDELRFGSLTQTGLVTCIIVGIIALVGVIGNGLMLRAYIKYKKLRTNFYTVFCSISIADTVFLLVCAPTYINSAIKLYYHRLTESEIRWCRLSFYVMDAANFTSAYLLVVLTVLRAIMLTSRNVRRQPKPFHLVVLSCAIYVIAFASSIPILTASDPVGGGCKFEGVYDGEHSEVEEWMKSLFSVFLPLGLMLIVHFVAHKLSKRYFSDSYSPREREKSRLVITIVAAFTICQLPNRIASLYFTSTYDLTKMNIDFDKLYQLQNMKRYLSCIWFLDKAIRPILYSKLASDLCEAFDEVINCAYCARASLQRPMFDQRESPHVTAVVRPNHVIEHVSNSAPDLAVTHTDTQATLIENVEVYSDRGGEVPDEGYGDSNCSASAGSSEEAHADHAGIDCDGREVRRLMSTSSSSSATSHTPLVLRGNYDDVDEDDVV